MSDHNLSVKHARQNCIECCAGSRAAVTWCTNHGNDGSRCEFWFFRFGKQPATFRARYGDRLLTPSMMPNSSVELESLPAKLPAAAIDAIDVDGYRQPPVTVKRKARAVPTQFKQAKK